MNYDFFCNKMTGNWIVQSTNYSYSPGSFEFTDTVINYTKWTHIKDYGQDLSLILNNLNIQETTSNTKLYCIQYQNDSAYNKHYVLLVQQGANKACMLKFNYKLDLVNKFTIKSCSERCLYIVSKIDSFTFDQKIYFLNNNLKLVKSVVKRQAECVSTSFSSEIKIS